MTLWLVSDRHLFHTKLQELTGRSADFDDRFISRCAKDIKDGDTVIDLGDVIVGKASRLAEIQSMLHGNWILVRGNHDNHSSWFESRGFVLAVESFVREWRGLMVLFSHEPVVPLPFGIDYNVHGHHHNNSHHFEELITNSDYLLYKDKYLLVEIESECRPVTLNEFMEKRTDR